MSDTPTSSSGLEESQEQKNRITNVNETDLVAALQAASVIRSNKERTIRTRELDVELAQAKKIVNTFLSRHAYDALAAMEFMFMVVPTQMTQLAHVLSGHRFTYLPLVDTLNQIAIARQAKREGGDNAEEEHGS